MIWMPLFFTITPADEKRLIAAARARQPGRRAKLRGEIRAAAERLNKKGDRR